MPVAEMQCVFLAKALEAVIPLAGGTKPIFAKAVKDAKNGKEEDTDLTSL